MPEAGHLFGGQVLAQGLVAAHRSLGGGPAHSLHAYFLRRGTPTLPIRYEVQSLRAGRSFRTGTVTAVQNDAAILQMTISYHGEEPGPSHQIPMDAVGGPEGEAYEQALIRAMSHLRDEDDDTPFELPVEIRGVGGIAMFSEEIKPPNVRCWMRVRSRLPDDPLLHQCMFAYASDYAIMVPALHPHPFGIDALQTASLDHALWFHDDFRMDEWVLFELDSPVTRGARGIGRGLLYTESGDLVGSCVQEGLLRPLRAPE
jgi:acyl-CoA thioesterase-2